MGLTIHYQLSSRRRLDLAGVLGLAKHLRTAAEKLSAPEVSEVFEVGPDFPGALYWRSGAKRASDFLSPLEGWLCSVDPGEGSESLFLGLCRYAGVAGWHLRGSCKTQYAARHGWEHFLACHRRVIGLLRAAEGLGLRVKVNDEGGLWKTGSEALLCERLGEYDRLLAGFTGVLKDAIGEAAIVAPITEDARFERLEAEGRQEREVIFTQAAEIIRQETKKPRGENPR